MTEACSGGLNGGAGKPRRGGGYKVDGAELEMATQTPRRPMAGDVAEGFWRNRALDGINVGLGGAVARARRGADGIHQWPGGQGFSAKRQRQRLFSDDGDLQWCFFFLAAVAVDDEGLGRRQDMVFGDSEIQQLYFFHDGGRRFQRSGEGTNQRWQISGGAVEGR
ncbi:hypothetical protein J5N97_021470 [Dioscorea zingiberensis]|uniref:Uncharacterized protein n=1 Tax=Dioscorea zingiberensis TaxID=325984 RepID=A0A9D5CHX1_9LILI|nr:hypothetical protein J5N97_021470 [Dioscorea zingiberensis]